MIWFVLFSIVVLLLQKAAEFLNFIAHDFLGKNPLTRKVGLLQSALWGEIASLTRYIILGDIIFRNMSKIEQKVCTSGSGLTIFSHIDNIWMICTYTYVHTIRYLTNT